MMGSGASGVIRESRFADCFNRPIRVRRIFQLDTEASVYPLCNMCNMLDKNCLQAVGVASKRLNRLLIVAHLVKGSIGSSNVVAMQ